MISNPDDPNAISGPTLEPSGSFQSKPPSKVNSIAHFMIHLLVLDFGLELVTFLAKSDQLFCQVVTLWDF